MATTWIILVNWNGGVDTVECLESLLRLDNDDFAVVIVDNASSDGTVKRLCTWAAAENVPCPDGPPWPRLPVKRRHCADLTVVDASNPLVPLPSPTSRITLLTAGANLGFAAANNLGMRFAAADPQMQYYWLLNNDTVVEPKSLISQRRRMDTQPKIGMLGARLMFYGEPNIVQGLAGGYHRLRARGYHIGLGSAPDALPDRSAVEAEMAYVLGASIFVRRTVVDDIGGMSERYFLYFEELDWACRLPHHFRLGVAYDAIVFHKEGSSIGSATRSRPSATSLYYLNANLLRFTWIHDRTMLPIVLLRVLRGAAGFFRRGDSEAVRATVRPIADLLLGVRRRGRYGSEAFERGER